MADGIGSIRRPACHVIGAIHTLEGEPPPMTVVLELPSKEAAHAWYDSEEYQAGIHHRIDNTEGHMVLVDEFSMPG
jgi:uncharacterized protein (DUF1330 family)